MKLALRLFATVAFLAAFSTASVAQPEAVASRLLGSWRCSGYAPGSASTETYTRAADGSFLLTNAVRTSTGISGTTVEALRYDRASETWTLDVNPNPYFGGMSLSAAVWRGDQWVFTGTETIDGTARQVRIIYTDLGPLAFRREHQQQLGNVWADDAEFVCQRTSALPEPVAPPAPAPRIVDATTAAVPPAAATPAPFVDHAYDLLGRPWLCRRGGASIGYSYAVDSALAIHLSKRRSGARRVAESGETYRYDPAHKLWFLQSDTGGFNGVAAKWFADLWTFEGVASASGSRVPSRLVYTREGPAAFRRDLQELQNGTWSVVTSETCSR